MAPAPADTIGFACERCGRSFRVDARRAGTRGRCPQCGADIHVPETGADPARAEPSRPFHPDHIDHIRVRVPLYALPLRRRQRRLGVRLTQDEARTYVLRLYHEQCLQVATLVMIGLILFAVLSVLTDGLVGGLKALALQVAWAVPAGGLTYLAGRFLCVPAPGRAT